MARIQSTGRTCTSLTQYLKGVKSVSARREVRQIVKRRCGSELSRLNYGRRVAIQDAIFAVEDRLESQNGGQTDHPTVKQLNAARQLVLDDLGWNEYPDS